VRQSVRGGGTWHVARGTWHVSCVMCHFGAHSNREIRYRDHSTMPALPLPTPAFDPRRGVSGDDGGAATALDPFTGLTRPMDSRRAPPALGTAGGGADDVPPCDACDVDVPTMKPPPAEPGSACGGAVAQLPTGTAPRRAPVPEPAPLTPARDEPPRLAADELW
jgi:hypothetical protein